MPYQSKAQQRLMFAKEERGEVAKGTAKRWAHETKNMKKLPERKRKKSAADFGAELGDTAANTRK
jgi:hypothetical protein